MTLKFFIFLIYFVFSTNVYANDMGKAFAQFKMGNYVGALEILSAMKSSKKVIGPKTYLEAVTLSKLQRYDEANIKFKNCLSLGYSTKDIFYEYGQSLYAGNDLENARIIFKRSAQNNYKKDISHYYIAHISQILEQWKLAKTYYLKIINTSNAETSILQVAHFQLGEVLLAIPELKKENLRKLVQDFVLPRFDLAIRTDKFSLLSKEIIERKYEIQKQYDLDPTLFKSGEPIPAKKFLFSFTQGFSYDNNVTYATDAPTSIATQKDSNIFSTNIFSSYTSTFKRRWTLTPQLGFGFLYHQDRDASEVFQNDQYSLSPGMSSNLKHKLFNDPASFILDWQYNYIHQDKDAVKSLDFYSKSYTVTLGEKMRLFGQGDTSFKLKYKNVTSYINTLDSNTKTFSIDHVIVLQSYQMIYFLFSYDIYDSITDSSDQTTLLNRVDYIIPGIADQYLLDLAMSVNLGTKDLSQIKTTFLSPSATLTKSISDKSSLNVSYTYTKVISDSISEEYTKHVTAIDYKFNF